MFDPRSDYALNKLDPDAIVCKSVNGAHTRITRADFASEEEFRRWKAWSDENYHIAEKADHIYANHTAPADTAESAATVMPSPERVLERLENKHDAEEAIVKIKAHLTEKQFRRCWLHYVEGLSVEVIARMEGRAHSSVSESIRSAKEKILILGLENPTDHP